MLLFSSRAARGRSVVSSSGPPVSGSLENQIIVHPSDPRWLAYNTDDGSGNVSPFFMSGPGDPEGFLYRGTRNADGTRSGDQSTLIQKLADNGGNCIYMIAVRSHGGDGGADENPFIDSDPTNALDDDILTQWDGWFDEMDAAGIVAMLFFYDDSASIWSTGDSVDADEQAFIEGIVDKFAHHTHLIWCVAEEYEEAFSTARVSNIASVIRNRDPNNHPIAVHQLGTGDNLVFDFADDANIDQHAIQHNVATATELNSGMNTAWDNAAGRYNLNMSESADHYTGTSEEARKKSWASAMGGAYVMVLFMFIDDTPTSDLADLQRIADFFEGSPLFDLIPDNARAFGDTEYVMAAADDSAFVLYQSARTGDLGVTALPAGDYDLHWLDCVDGDTVDETLTGLSSGDQTFTTPASMGAEVALRVTVVS